MRSLPRPRTRRARALAASCVVAAAATVFAATSQVTAAPAAAAPEPDGGAKPAIVLVHGAWADASSWNAVIARLQHAGYTVYAPPNPLREVSYDAQTLASFVATIPGPVVLVGHSYGGMVISNAAAKSANV
ncbi:alpha/beta fold hydrolase [Streptomyces sp. NPDC001093]|uniref:alpha/beta fold hydrolase n=1 Tax=Streptomyces sp. NPDC001093 TaxID=3154376 RepID=UPI00331988CC